jgi:hypothetical protein
MSKCTDTETLLMANVSFPGHVAWVEKHEMEVKFFWEDF